MSLRELGERIDRDFPTLSRWESGERVPKPQHVAQILALLGVEGDGFRRVMRLGEDLDQTCWVASAGAELGIQRDAYLAVSATAVHVTEVASRVVPPLLRTRQVATVMARAGEVPADQVDAHLAGLFARQRAVLHQESTSLTVLVGADALGRSMGRTESQVAQLERLLRLAEHPRIDLRVTPADGSPDFSQPFTVTRTPHATLAVLHLRGSTVWLHRPEDLDRLTEDVEFLRANASSPADSVAEITEVLRAHGTADLVQAG